MNIDGPIAVIADVHGCSQLLFKLILGMKDAGYLEDRWIVFAGDLVDKGPDSMGVIQMALDLQEMTNGKVTACMGNHDLNLMRAIGVLPSPKGREDYWPEKYSNRNYSRPTFRSYGCRHGDLVGLKEAMPQEHINFLSSLPWVVEHPDYYIIHATVFVL